MFQMVTRRTAMPLKNWCCAELQDRVGWLNWGRPLMAHWNEVRDAWRVEKLRELTFLPSDLVENYERSGDIYEWEAIIKLLQNRHTGR
jgi:hypothetical protein